MYARVCILINSILQSCRNPKTRYRCNLRANRIANGTIRPTIKCRHYKRSSPSSRLPLYGRFIRVNFVLSKRVLIPSFSRDTRFTVDYPMFRDGNNDVARTKRVALLSTRIRLARRINFIIKGWWIMMDPSRSANNGIEILYLRTKENISPRRSSPAKQRNYSYVDKSSRTSTKGIFAG